MEMESSGGSVVKTGTKRTYSGELASSPQPLASSPQHTPTSASPTNLVVLISHVFRVAISVSVVFQVKLIQYVNGMVRNFIFFAGESHHKLDSFGEASSITRSRARVSGPPRSHFPTYSGEAPPVLFPLLIHSCGGERRGLLSSGR